jgi:hypothetical protein
MIADESKFIILNLNFLKSELSKIEFYLKVKKSFYTEIQETDDYVLDKISAQCIYLGMD